jgi:hypothetical protein
MPKSFAEAVPELIAVGANIAGAADDDGELSIADPVQKEEDVFSEEADVRRLRVIGVEMHYGVRRGRAMHVDWFTRSGDARIPVCRAKDFAVRAERFAQGHMRHRRDRYASAERTNRTDPKPSMNCEPMPESVSAGLKHGVRHSHAVRLRRDCDRHLSNRSSRFGRLTTTIEVRKPTDNSLRVLSDLRLGESGPKSERRESVSASCAQSNTNTVDNLLGRLRRCGRCDQGTRFHTTRQTQSESEQQRRTKDPALHAPHRGAPCRRGCRRGAVHTTSGLALAYNI